MRNYVNYLNNYILFKNKVIINNDKKIKALLMNKSDIEIDEYGPNEYMNNLLIIPSIGKAMCLNCMITRSHEK